MCPKASTMPSWARMRLASESSSRMAARLSAMEFSLGAGFAGRGVAAGGPLLHKAVRFACGKNRVWGGGPDDQDDAKVLARGARARWLDDAVRGRAGARLP